MATNTDQIRVGASGTVYVAPVGTAAPADVATAWGVGWLDLGFLSEDGVTFTDEKTVEDIPAWQSFYPARKIVTAKDARVSFVLREWSRETVQLAFGGGTITATGVAPDIHYRYDPPAPETLDQRAVGVEWKDGTLIYRLIMVKAIVTEAVETNLVRTAASDLPITLGMIGAAGVAPWYLRTNDPSFAA